jgi:Asp-tRNA(Asn)/Glu-tRNA(Gln) amidotransferase A subunit family amidase
VPAALNNIVGLKPSLGLVSTAGFVPACRSLDCASVLRSPRPMLAAVIAGPDQDDPYSRRMSLESFPPCRRSCGGHTARRTGSSSKIAMPRPGSRRPEDRRRAGADLLAST